MKGHLQLAYSLFLDILHRRGISIWRAHLDTVLDPENTVQLDDTRTLPGYVTLLRILVSPDPQVAGVTGATPDVVFGPGRKEKNNLV